MRTENYKRAFELDAKVEASNSAAEYCNELSPVIADIFKPFIGKKILKKDRRFLSKIETLLPEDPEGLRMFYRAYMSGVSFEVTACEHVKETEHVQYMSRSFWPLSLEGDILLSVNDCKPLKCDHDADDIRSKREAVELAEKALRDAKAELSGFDMCDH